VVKLRGALFICDQVRENLFFFRSADPIKVAISGEVSIPGPCESRAFGRRVSHAASEVSGSGEELQANYGEDEEYEA